MEEKKPKAEKLSKKEKTPKKERVHSMSIMSFLKHAKKEEPAAAATPQLSEMPVVPVVPETNEANEANKDPDSVFISGNSRPCLIDILMFGTVRQMKELNSVSCFASPTTTNWFNTMDDVLQLLLIRRRLQYWTVC